MKSGNLNVLVPPGPVQACNGNDLPLTFVHLNKHLTGIRLSEDAEVKQAVTSCLQTLDIDFFHARTKALVPHSGISA